jgi:hypothetical protein
LSSLAISDSNLEVKSKPEVEDTGWIFPRGTVVNILVYNPSISSAWYRSPNWFDLLQEENTDPLGPLPAEWGFTLRKVPSLFALNLDGEWRDTETRPYEPLRDFSPAYNNQDEALRLQVAVRRSQEGTQALEDRQASPSSQASQTLHCMATVLEMPDEGEPIAVSSKPEGSILNEPRYTGRDKV